MALKGTMVEAAGGTLEELNVVAAFMSVAATAGLGFALYRLSRRDEVSRMSAVLEADRQGRVELFEHERALRRGDHRREALHGLVLSLRALLETLNMSMTRRTELDAKIRAVGTFGSEAGSAALLSPDGLPYMWLRVLSDKLEKWVEEVAAPGHPPLEQLNERTQELVEVVASTLRTVEEAWLDDLVERQVSPTSVTLVEWRGKDGQTVKTPIAQWGSMTDDPTTTT